MEAPIYDNIFIQLGPFHILMSFFKPVRMFISESGFPNVLTESEELARLFLLILNGTNFNRNKRIHPMPAAALEIFSKSFIKQEETMGESSLKSLLLQVKMEPCDQRTFSKVLLNLVSPSYLVRPNRWNSKKYDKIITDKKHCLNQYV